MTKSQFPPNPNRDRARALARELADMTNEERTRLLGTFPPIRTIEGRILGTKNQLMVFQQMPSATIIGGFKQWQRAGRRVRTGQSALYIWVPRETPDADNADPDDDIEVRFRLSPVFDVTQTEPISTQSPPKAVAETTT